MTGLCACVFQNSRSSWVIRYIERYWRRYMNINERNVESPCVRNCCLDEDDICIGCFRSLSEITEWALVGDKGRQDILDNSARRKRKLAP